MYFVALHRLLHIYKMKWAFACFYIRMEKNGYNAVAAQVVVEVKS